MTEWTLNINGTTQTLSEWRVHSVLLGKQSFAIDTLSFVAPRGRIDEDQLCGFGDTIQLLRDGEIWFTGTCDTIPEDAQAAGESQTYQVLNAWRWLEQNNYQQQWYNGTIYTSHCILNGTIGNNIKSVLDYAIANGAGLQYVSSELDVLTAIPPASEFTEKYCASVIVENLQFAPDIVGWFDYATSPPTLHLKRRHALEASSVRFASYTTDESLPKAAMFKPIRLDKLSVPAVKINGETLVTVDGTQLQIPSVDIYPPGATGREDRAFNAVILLQGSTVRNLFGELETEAIDTTSLDWFKRHCDALRDTRINISRLVPGSVQRLDKDGNVLPVTYASELIPGGGTIADWMENETGTPIIAQREFFRFKIDLEFNETFGDGVPLVGLKDQLFSFDLVTTNAAAGHTEYSAIESVDSGDPSIVGLAQFLYESLNHFDGGVAKTQYAASITLQEQECTGQIDLGSVVNLFGGRAEYETMRALIQSISFNIDNGVTEITCGPPRQWTIGSLLALLERFRVRRRWTNPLTQETGETESGTDRIDLPTASANINTLPGGGISKFMSVKDGNTLITMNAVDKRIRFTNSSGLGTIELDLDDLAQVTPAVGSFLAKFRLTNLCDANNHTVRAYVLRTDTFT